MCFFFHLHNKTPTVLCSGKENRDKSLYSYVIYKLYFYILCFSVCWKWWEWWVQTINLVFSQNETTLIKCSIYFFFSMKQMKKNKILYDSAMKQFDVLLPEDYKEPYKSALTKCKDSTGGAKNACDAAYNMLKCFHANNPKFTFA